MSHDPNTPDPDDPERRARRRPLTLTLIVGAAVVGGLLTASFAVPGNFFISRSGPPFWFSRRKETPQFAFGKSNLRG